VRLLDGRVLVVGCCGGGGGGALHDLTSAELYDPASGTWSPTGSLAKPLAANVIGTASLLRDGRVLVLVSGAEDEVGGEVYDPASGTWTATGPTVSGANYVGDTAVVLQDGRVLMAGRSGAQIYDPSSGTWSATGKMTIPRHYTTATLLPDGRVIFVGGDVVPDRRVAAAELFDPNTGSWTEIASRHSAEAIMASWLQPDGTVLVIGNELVEAYDPVTGIWTALAEPTESGDARALLADGSVLMSDLHDPNAEPGSPQPPCTATARYDPRSGSWTTASSMLRCAYGSSFTLLLDGTVLVAGGQDCNDDGACVPTGAAVLFVPAGVSPPPLPAFPSPPPPVFPSPAPTPTPFPPADGPVPPNARSWKVTVDNQSSEPATLFVAEEDEDGTLRLVGSATPNVVPAGASVKVTFLFPADSVPDDGWIYVSSRLETGSLVGAADIGIPGKIVIGADGQVGWLSPPGY
jgi:hypothetical protein